MLQLHHFFFNYVFKAEDSSTKRGSVISPKKVLLRPFTPLISVRRIAFTQRESEATHAAAANPYHASLPIHQVPETSVSQCR